MFKLLGSGLMPSSSQRDKQQPFGSRAMASRKQINNDEQHLLKERLRSVLIDLQWNVERLERRLRRLLWDLQETSKMVE